MVARTVTGISFRSLSKTNEIDLVCRLETGKRIHLVINRDLLVPLASELSAYILSNLSPDMSSPPPVPPSSHPPENRTFLGAVHCSHARPMPEPGAGFPAIP